MPSIGQNLQPFWCLNMSEIFSRGTKNNKQINKSTDDNQRCPQTNVLQVNTRTQSPWVSSRDIQYLKVPNNIKKKQEPLFSHHFFKLGSTDPLMRKSCNCLICIISRDTVKVRKWQSICPYMHSHRTLFAHIVVPLGSVTNNFIHTGYVHPCISWSIIPLWYIYIKLSRKG